MFYLVNKHKNITSFWVICALRKKLNIRKIWHIWTLDPLATGLLVIASWKYTKLIPYLEKQDKTYLFTFNIDWISPTWDLEWIIEYFNKEKIEEYKKRINEKIILDLLKEKFSWKIKQIPPKYSAIKINWEKAYNKARNWEEFKMKEREIEILKSELIKYDFPSVTIRMTVSSWSYIRTIAEDIWKSLWLWGYITELHREKIGNIDLKTVKILDEINISDWIYAEKIFTDIKTIEVPEEIQKDLLNWKDVKINWNIDWRYFLKYNSKIISFVKYSKWKLEYLANDL